MWFEKKANAAIWESLIDLQSIRQRNQKGTFSMIKSANGGSDDTKAGKASGDPEPERFNIGHNSCIQSCLKKKDLCFDILPLVYVLIHPEIREINIQLFTAWEKEIFLRAIELMVFFDIKLVQPKQPEGDNFLLSGPGATQSYIAHFEPDIAKVVTFGQNLRDQQKYMERDWGKRQSGYRKEGGANQLFMRHKTQILIMQNYEKVKQSMLTGQSTDKSIFINKLTHSDKGATIVSGIKNFMT